jgi:hypothetical protein
MFLRKNILILALLASVYFLCQYAGLFIMVREMDYYTEFKYPLEGDITKYVEELEKGLQPSIEPYDNHNTNFLVKNEEKCVTSNDSDEPTLPIRVVYLVKSAVLNIENRMAIRQTWGYEKRFADVSIRTVFLLGSVIGPKKIEIENAIAHENEKYRDIVLGDFIDSYYNNTIKTLMGIKWAAEFCSNSRFYFFVDDDYYVSTRNLLRFLRNPSNYPKYLEDPTINFDDVEETNRMNSKLRNGRNLRADDGQILHPFSASNRKLQQLIDFDLPEDVELYAGFVFFPKPHRHKFSKWYISLEEYPYHKFPPYVSAGAYILSNVALKKFYYATYFVKRFRFDDVYLGIVAKKLDIEPFHSDEFWFYRKYPYSVKDFRYTIASHEFSDPQEMKKVWNQQKQAGHS